MTRWRDVWASALSWSGALGIATIVVMRCVITFAPQVVFDVDPLIDPTPLPGLGPGGSLYLDALLLVACAAALLGESLAGRGLDWWLLALALVPAPVALWHGAGDAIDLWRGSTWVAAAAACATVAHLGRRRAIRLVLVALVVAVLVPLVARGALQSSIAGWNGPEHAGTLAEYEVNREAFLADRGWTPETPAARIYERRLRQADPRGWFPTTNIWASLMAFGVVYLSGLALAAARARARGLIPLVAAVLVVAAALVAARSKGAMLAAACGLALVAAPAASSTIRALLDRWGGVVAVALVAAAFAAPWARGMLGEGWLGEKSLLFRRHYLGGAVAIVAEHPLAGVGPAGFQEAYAAVRSPRSPEEVSSAHSVFADWPALLGVSGAAWIVLVLVLVRRAGARGPGAGAEDGPPTGRGPPSAVLFSAAAVAIVGLAGAVVIEYRGLDGPAQEAARALGAIGFVLAAAGLGVLLDRLPPRSADWALAAAAVALVVHGQIEMTFFDPGSATWVMCALGLAGGAVARRRVPGLGPAVAALFAAAAVWIAVTGAGPAVRATLIMVRAAEVLHEHPDDPYWRAAAVEMLVDAHDEQMPTYAAPLEEASDALLLRSRVAAIGDRRALIDEAVRLADRAVNEHGTATSISLAGRARWTRARMSMSPADWQAAVDFARRMTVIDPHGIQVWVWLGDVLWECGRRDEAADAYHHALESDRNFVLDPLKQLSERDRDRLRARVPEMSP